MTRTVRTPSRERARDGVSVAATKQVAVADLKPHARNPRRGDVDLIVSSLEAHGQYRAIVVRDGTNEVLAGNHTLAAAKQLGWQKILVHYVEVDDDEAKRILLVDNRANDAAGYDQRELRDLLGELPDLAGTGYDAGALADLESQIQALDPVERPDDSAPDPPAEPTTKPGDLWLLGEHRLLCGDSTVATDYERLLRAERAALLWTDPPYGLSYVGKTADALTIDNDDKEGLDALLRDAFAMADTALADGAAIYIAHPPGALSVTFGVRFLEQGWRLRQVLVWAKDSMVLGHADYHYKHEAVLFGYKRGGGRRGRGGEGWYGDNAQTTVFEVSRPRASREHPTMKPIELIEIALRNSSRPGDIVLDCFGGSGTTLMACEMLARKARLIELSPSYCDVIVRRWEEHTGQKAVLDGGE